MLLFEVQFVSDARYDSNWLKVKANNMLHALEKVIAKYPDKQIRYIEMLTTKPEEIIE